MLLFLPAGGSLFALTKRWDGGGGNTKWSNGSNWRSDEGGNDNVVPAAGDDVILDHSSVAGAYTVNIDSNTATIRHFTIAATNITLTFGANKILSMSGNWTNNGDAIGPNDGKVDMTGTGTIGGTAADVFYKLNVSAAGQITTLAKDVTVSNVLKIQAGTINSSVAGSFRTVTLTLDNADPLDTVAGLTVTDVKILLDPAGSSGYSLFKINGALFDLEINDSAGNGSGGTITFNTAAAGITFNHDLIVTAGILDTNRKTLTVGNDLIHTSGTIDFALGTFALTGAYDGEGKIDGAGTTTFNKLVLGQAGQIRTFRFGKNFTVGDLMDVGDVAGGGGGTTTVLSTVGGVTRIVTLTDNVDPLDTASNVTFTDVNLKFNPAGNYTVNGISSTTQFASVELDDGGGGRTVTAGSAWTMSASFTLTSGTFSAGAFTHAVGRDFVYNGGTFTAGTSTISMTGTGQIRGSSGTTLTFANLTLAPAGGTTTLARAATVTTVLTFGTGAANSDVAGTTRTLTLTRNTGASPLAFGATTPSVTGDVRLNLAPASSSYSITGPLPLSLGSIQVSAGAANTITFGQALTLNGDLIVTTGTLTTGAFTHTLGRGLVWDGGTLDTTSSTPDTSLTFTGTGTFGGAAAGTVTLDGLSFAGASTDIVTLSRSVTVAGTFAIASGTLGTSGLSAAITVTAQSGLSVGDGSGAADSAVLDLIGPVTLAVQSGQTLSVSGVDGRLHANSNGAGTPGVTRAGAGTYAFTVSGTVDVNALTVDYTDGNGLAVTVANGASPNVTALNNVTFSNSTTVALKIAVTSGAYGCATTPVDFVGHVYNSAVTNCSFLPAAGCGAGGSNACPGTSVCGWIRMIGFGGTGGGDAGDADCADPSDTGGTGTVIEWAPPKKWVSSAGSSTDWFTDSNWNPSGVPGGSDTVLIPVTSDPQRLSAAMPTIAAGTATTGSIIQQTGTTLTSTSGTLNVAGSWTLTGTADFVPGTGTVVFNGTSAQTVPNETYNNLTASNTSGVTLGNGSGTVTVNGTLTVTGSLNWGSGTVVLANGLAVNGASGAVMAGTGTTQLNGGAATDITTDQASKTVTFGNLTINGAVVAGTAGNPVDLVVQRTLLINSGTSLSLGGTTRTLTLGGVSGVTAVWDNNAGASGFAEGDDTVVFSAPVDGPDVAETFAALTVNGSGSNVARIRAGTTTVSGALTVNGGILGIDPGAVVVLSSASAVTHTVASGATLRLDSNTSLAGTLQIAGNAASANRHTMSIAGELKATWDETLSPLPPRPTVTRRAGDTGRFVFVVSGTLSVEGLSFSYGGVEGVANYEDGLNFEGTGSANELRNVDFTNALTATTTTTNRAGAHFKVRSTAASVAVGGCSFDLAQTESGTSLSTTAGSNVVTASGNRVTAGCRRGHILHVQSGGDIGGYVITDTNATDGTLAAGQLRIDVNLAATGTNLTYRVINVNIRAEDTSGGNDLRLTTDATDTTLEEYRDFDDFDNGAVAPAAKSPSNATANTSRIDWLQRVTSLATPGEAGSETADAELQAARSGVQGSLALTYNTAPAAASPVPNGNIGILGPRAYYIVGRKVGAGPSSDLLACVELFDGTTVGKRLAAFSIDTAYGEAIGPPAAVILNIQAGDADTPDTSPSTLGSLPRQVEDIFFGTTEGWLFRVRHDFSTIPGTLRLCSVQRGAGSAFPRRPRDMTNATTQTNTLCVEFTTGPQLDVFGPFSPGRLFFGGVAAETDGAKGGTGAAADTYRIYGVDLNSGNVITTAPEYMLTAGLGSPARAPFAVLGDPTGGTSTILLAGLDESGGVNGTGGSLWRTATGAAFSGTVSFTATTAGADDSMRSSITVGIDADRVYTGCMNGRVYGRRSVSGMATITGYPDAGYDAGSAVGGGVALGWDAAAGARGWATADNVFFGDDAGAFHSVDGFAGADLASSPAFTPVSPRGASAFRSYPLEGPLAGQAAGGNYFYTGNNDGVLFWINKLAPDATAAGSGVYKDFGAGRRVRDVASAFGRIFVPTDKGELFVVPAKP